MCMEGHLNLLLNAGVWFCFLANPRVWFSGQCMDLVWYSCQCSTLNQFGILVNKKIWFGILINFLVEFGILVNPKVQFGTLVDPNVSLLLWSILRLVWYSGQSYARAYTEINLGGEICAKSQKINCAPPPNRSFQGGGQIYTVNSKHLASLI